MTSLLAFLGPAGLLLRLESNQKFLDLPIQTVNFAFGSIAIYFHFKFGPILGLFALSKPCWALRGVENKFKKFLGTSSYTLSTLVLKVQSNLFVFIQSHFEPFGAMLSYFWSWDQVQNLFWYLHILQTVNYSFIKGEQKRMSHFIFYIS